MIVAVLLFLGGMAAAPMLITAAYTVLPESLPVVTPMVAVVAFGVILLIKRKLTLGLGLIIGTVGWGAFIAFVLNAYNNGMPPGF